MTLLALGPALARLWPGGRLALWIGAGALTLILVGGGWLRLSALEKARDRLTAERAELVQRLSAEQAAHAQARRALAALAAAEADARARRAARDRLQKEIRDAPEADDGPLAPVLSRALGRLREPEGGVPAVGAAPAGGAF